jgi:hypothetical protein
MTCEDGDKKVLRRIFGPKREWMSGRRSMYVEDEKTELDFQCPK